MGIYPEINLPTLLTPRKSSKYTQKISPKFDWNTGEFLFSPGGKIKMSTPEETFEQWCVKVCTTERFSRLAYSDKYGVELEKISTMSDIEAAKSEIIRTITEAIMVHPQTELVKNFSFKVVADSIWVSFDVKAKSFDKVSRIEVKL